MCKERKGAEANDSRTGTTASSPAAFTILGVGEVTEPFGIHGFQPGQEWRRFVVWEATGHLLSMEHRVQIR